MKIKYMSTNNVVFKRIRGSNRNYLKPIKLISFGLIYFISLILKTFSAESLSKSLHYLAKFLMLIY